MTNSSEPKKVTLTKEQMQANMAALNKATSLQYANMEAARATAEASIGKKPTSN